MAYNEFLADRITQYMKSKGISFTEKKMMGGLTYMVDEKMCVGIVQDKLMARIAPEIYDHALEKEGCRPMDFTNKPMKGFVFIDPIGYDLDEDLEYWINLALEFNPRAKSSKKR